MKDEVLQECCDTPPVHWLWTAFLLIINLHPSIQQARCQSPSELSKTVSVGHPVAITLGSRRCRVYTCVDDGKFGLNLQTIDYSCNSVFLPEDRCDNILNPDIPLYRCCSICGDFRFLHEPAPFYYATYGSDITIPCKIVDTLLGNRDNPFVRSSTFFRNGIHIMPSSFQHYILQRDAKSDHIVGLAITSASQEDDNVVVHCTLQSGESVALRSRNTTVFIGDGTPLAPSQPPLISSVTVRSAAVEWVEFMTITHAPILSYTIYYWSSAQSLNDAVSVETPSNATTFTIMPTPGFSYFVAVRGINSVGLGAISARGTVSIPLGEVPPAPQNLKVNHENISEVLLIITWQVPMLNLDRMTPISEYRIFFTHDPLGTESPGTGLVGTVEGDTPTYRLLVHEDGTFRVGVAAVNAAGQSDIASTDIIITSGMLKLKKQPTTPKRLPATLQTQGTPKMTSQAVSEGVITESESTTNEVSAFVVIGVAVGISLTFFLIVVTYRVVRRASKNDTDSKCETISSENKQTMLSSTTIFVRGSKSEDFFSYNRTHDVSSQHKKETTGRQGNQYQRVRRQSSAPMLGGRKKESLPKCSNGGFRMKTSRTPGAVSPHETQSVKTASKAPTRRSRKERKQREENTLPFSKKEKVRKSKRKTAQPVSRSCIETTARNALPQCTVSKKKMKTLSRENVLLLRSRGPSKEEEDTSFNINVL